MNRLAELSPDEFENLCNGCGLCCSIGEGYACPALDVQSNRCTKYAQPAPRGEICVKLTPENVPLMAAVGALPESCTYVRYHAGLPLDEPPPRAEWQEFRIAPEGIQRRFKQQRADWLRNHRRER